MNEIGLILGKIIQKIKISKQFSVKDFYARLEPCFEKYGYRKVRGDKEEILVISLNAIGDNVVYSAFIRELRMSYPRSVITVITNPVVYELYEESPYVNHVLQLPYSQIETVDQWMERFVEFAQEKLLQQHFTKSICVQWSDNKQPMNFLSYISGARERYGISDKSIMLYNNNFFLMDQWENLLTDLVVTPVNVMHEAERALYVLVYMGKTIHSKSLELWISEADRNNVEDILQKYNLPIGKYIILGIGAREINRKYPLEQWGEVIETLFNIYHMPFVICGGRDEVDDGKVLEKKVSAGLVVNLAGKLTLRETGAIIEYSRCYLGNVTGMMHMAAALSVPLVCLFREAKIRAKAPEGVFSEYVRFAPWQCNAISLRPETAMDDCLYVPVYGGCKHTDKAHCLAAITPEEIIEAVRKIMQY